MLKWYSYERFRRWRTSEAEVGFTNDFALEQLVACPLGDDFARGKDIISGNHFKNRTDFRFSNKYF